MSEPNAIDDRMAEFNKAMGYQWTPEQLEQQSRLAKQHNELDFAPKYPQNESSRVIQDSSYGYALAEELKARHQVQVQMLAKTYGQERVSPRAKVRLDAPYDRNDMWAAPRFLVIVASDLDRLYPLDNPADMDVVLPSSTEKCDVDISEQCTGAVHEELVMDYDQVLLHWNVCSTCRSWLSAMADVERESDDDRERKVKHYHEVLQRYGRPTRDLKPFMRSEG